MSVWAAGVWAATPVWADGVWFGMGAGAPEPEAEAQASAGGDDSGVQAIIEARYYRLRRKRHTERPTPEVVEAKKVFEAVQRVEPRVVAEIAKPHIVRPLEFSRQEVDWEALARDIATIGRLKKMQLELEDDEEVLALILAAQ